MKSGLLKSGAWTAEKIRIILTILVPFVYLAILCNSVTSELFWSDDPEELVFVRSRPFSQLFLGHDAFGYFRPVKNILWFIFSRLAPFGIEWCHVLAIAIGIVSFFPVLALCRRILANEWKALAAATVWLLSPTLVSSAAWLSSVNIQAMVAFAAASIVLHDSAWNDGVFRPSRIISAVGFFFLALVSYECAAAIAPVLLAFDWILRPGRLRSGNARMAHICYWIALVVYAVLRSFAGAVGEMSHRWIEATRVQLVLSSPFFTARHFADWFWPFGRFSVGGSYVWGEVSLVVLIGCALIGVAVLVFAILARRRFPALSFCLIFALLAFAPVSNCLGFGNGPYGDYYLALSSIGLAAGSIELVWIIAKIRGPLFLPAFAIATAFVLVRMVAVPEAARWARLWSRTDLAYAEGARNHPDSIQNQLGLLRNLVSEDNWGEAMEVGRQIESKVGAESSMMSFVYCSRAIHAITVAKDRERAKEAIAHYSKVSNDREKEQQVVFYEGLIAETIDQDLNIAEQKYLQALNGSHGKELLVCSAKAIARIWGNRGEWNKAVNLLEQAANIDPEDISLMWNLAIANRKAGNGKNSDIWVEKVRQRTGNLSLQIENTD